MNYEVWLEEDGREHCGTTEQDCSEDAARVYGEWRDEDHDLIDSSVVYCVAVQGSEYVERYSVRAAVSVDYYADRMVGP